jgi:sulfate adenylyltransferase subunit 2
MEKYRLTNLETLEAESIFIMREVVAEFEKPVMLYSVGKDSSVMVRLAQKAFAPNRVPFPLMHVDTRYKFPEMYEFRDKFCEENDLDLIVHSSSDTNMNPQKFGTTKCCKTLKTDALLEGLSYHKFDVAFGGARRDEERSRAKERIYSVRDVFGHWDPKRQRPELWNLFNSNINVGENVRVFPLSNWTELDVWMYIKKENIPIVPLYFSREGKRYRSIGCHHCTGSIESNASTVDDIIQELLGETTSERSGRVIDFDVDGSMEIKKREGYF